MIEREIIIKAVKRNMNLAETGRGVEIGWTEGMYDSSLEEISRDFFYCLPETYQELLGPFSQGEILEKYIIDTLGENNSVAIEFGGPGSRLFASFPENFFQKTIGVCLADIRSEERKKKDELRNHIVIPGDILKVVDKNNNVYKEIREEELGSRKVSLIISRIAGPLDLIQKNSAILDRVIRKWYEILEYNGVMFIQTEFSKDNLSSFSYIFFPQWCKVVREKFPTIEIQEKQGLPEISQEQSLGDKFIGAIRLHKKPGSPEKLPPATQLFRNKKS